MPRTLAGMALADDLRRAIEVDDRAEGAIAHAAGIARSVVWRLCRGEQRGVSLENAERLADAMGYDVVLKRRPRRSRKGR